MPLFVGEKLVFGLHEIRNCPSNPFGYSFWVLCEGKHAKEISYHHALTNCSRSFARPITQSGILRDKERANKVITPVNTHVDLPKYHNHVLMLDV